MGVAIARGQAHIHEARRNVVRRSSGGAVACHALAALGFGSRHARIRTRRNGITECMCSSSLERGSHEA